MYFLGVTVLDGLLYAVGGHDGPSVRKSVEVYSSESNTWSPVADMHTCRRNAGRYYITFLSKIPSAVINALHKSNCVDNNQMIIFS